MPVIAIGDINESKIKLVGLYFQRGFEMETSKFKVVIIMEFQTC